MQSVHAGVQHHTMHDFVTMQCMLRSARQCTYSSARSTVAGAYTGDAAGACSCCAVSLFAAMLAVQNLSAVDYR
jgi:hypothetical protein